MTGDFLAAFYLLICMWLSRKITERKSYCIKCEEPEIPPDPPGVHMENKETFFLNTIPRRPATFDVHQEWISETIHAKRMALQKKEGFRTRWKNFAFAYWCTELFFFFLNIVTEKVFDGHLDFWQRKFSIHLWMLRVIFRCFSPVQSEVRSCSFDTHTKQKTLTGDSVSDSLLTNLWSSWFKGEHLQFMKPEDQKLSPLVDNYWLCPLILSCIKWDKVHS